MITTHGGEQLSGIPNCPHCGIAWPLLLKLWESEGLLQGQGPFRGAPWAVFCCSACGKLVSAKGYDGAAFLREVERIYPDIWKPSEFVPERVGNYLSQAHSTLAAPDASVVMSAASIDAMLKDHELTDGSLYKRIDEAVVKGILTKTMAEWAHRVRLDANNPRHADASTPHMTPDDAKRAFDFANALVEYLYVLPSKMPSEVEPNGEPTK